MVDRQQYNYLAKVPHQLGYQVINDDGAVFISSGDLQNRDHFAGHIVRLVKSSGALLTEENTQALHVYFDTFYYSIVVANGRIVVVKKEIVT